MKLGTNDIGSVYLGTNAVQSVYLGSDLVYSAFSGGLLDTYTGAAAAYSLRRLSSSYTGKAIRVRRASDNTEQDIGFVGEDLNTSALTTFCSGTNGFVKTWYDQSGNGYDATQTTVTRQPQIVSSGSVITKGSKPCVQITPAKQTTSTRLLTNAFSINIPQPITVFSAFNQDVISDRQALFSGRLNLFRLYYFTSGWFQSAGVSLSYLDIATGQKLAYNLYNTTSSQMSINNATVITGDNGANELDGISIGNLEGVPNPLVDNAGFVGQIHELIFYPSNQSSNRTGIETNINNFYSIY